MGDEPNIGQSVTLYDENEQRVGTPERPLRTDPTGTTAQPSSSLWQTETRAGHGFGLTYSNASINQTAETPFILFHNPVGSGKLCRIKQKSAWYSAGVAQYAILRVYRDPTVTVNGTAINIWKILKSQAAATVASAYSMPTVSDNGTALTALYISGANVNVLIEDSDLGRLVEANEKLLVTVQLSAKNNATSLTMTWVETT